LSQKSTEQNVKDVINASSRAISKDKDLNLEVNYLQQVAEPGHNLQENIESMLNRNPILATALNATIGYEKGAQIVKKAYQEKRSIIDVAVEMTDLDSDTLAEILDPLKLTRNQ